MMGAGGARADTVIGADGTPGSICQGSDLDCDINGGDGESVSAGGNPAVAIGGNGGEAGGAEYGYDGGDGTGNGGSGGSATAVATGGSIVSASATGGDGGGSFLSYGGSGGNASAMSSAMGGSGGASSSAYATGGVGQTGLGQGGSATATALASASKGGLAVSEAVATGGNHLSLGPDGPYPGPANATSTAQSTFADAGVRSTDEAAVNMVTLSGTAIAYSGVATANAVAQAGDSGQSFVTPDNSAYAFSAVLPDKAEVATLIDGASSVASAFLGRDIVFGSSILGINYFSDGPVESFTYSESSTFDFHYQGDLLLGLIDGGGDFNVTINGVQVLAEDFVADSVINLGSSFGPNIDLTIVSYGSGDFVLGGAVPEPSTWAMLLLGFAGLGFVGYRKRPGAKPQRHEASTRQAGAQ
jgi:PEP-CTERM motif